MRIEKLELNKIKVTVYPVDLNDMNISIKNLKPDSPQLHSFLFRIMEKVKRETGFNPYSGQIVVEAFPVGDCVELTVTKICDKDKAERKPSKPTKVRATLKRTKIQNTVYCFDSFDTLCKVLTLLPDTILLTSACFSIENNYALTVKDISLKEHILLKEYANDYDTGRLTEAFLKEHGTLICESDRLLSMAQGIIELESNT